MSEILKAWCQWKKSRPSAEWDMDTVKEIEDLISQVGTWKAKFERLQAAWREHDCAKIINPERCKHGVHGEDCYQCYQPGPIG